jgi:cysteine-rich repeat protein
MRARGRAWGIVVVALAGCAGGAADDSRGDGSAAMTEGSSGGAVETTSAAASTEAADGSSTSTGATSGPTSTSGGESSSGETSSSGGSTSTGLADDSSGGSSGGPAGLCGDAAVDVGEACDDGNSVEGDGCNSDCRPSGVLLWSEREGGAAKLTDEALGCAVDEFGSIYLAGYMGQSKTNDDAWVRSYTAEGAVAWTHTHAGLTGLRDRGQAVAVDAAQLVYVAGYENVELQGNDVWVRKLAADGAPVWTRGYNGATSGTDVVYAATLTAAGDLLVAGSHAVEGQGLDVWLRKYDPAGTTLWTRTHAGAAGKADNGRAIAETSDGYIYVAGDENVELEGANAWLARYDADGNLLWERKYNGAASLDDIFYGAAATADGGVVACGVEKATMPASLSFARKYDADGLMVWTEREGGAEGAGALCFGVGLTGTGEVLLAGAEVAAAVQRPRVRRLGADGSARWTTLVANAGALTSQLRCVREAPDGTIVAAGGVDEGIDGRDAWVGRFSP